jgi:organic radical activating enzyme
MVMRSLDETKKIIDSVSDSFCAAKWYNATIWLSNGRTASCHHPIAHSIPVESIQKNASALHNTDYKKEQRRLMIAGERPEECSYCWRVEDNNDSTIFSDRIYKSHIYSIEDTMKLKELPHSQNIDPKTLEISFDNLCNLSCTYCNPEFSSTWSTDIKSNGKYENLLTPGGSTYTHSSEYTLPLNSKEENIYIEKFFEWYNSSLKYGLQELRVTGGEPSRSPHFWRLLEQCTDANFDFAVNSNLIMSEARLNLLINAAGRFKKFDLYTSCESYGKHAEFVRHGLKYDVWKNNLKSFVTTAKFNSVHIMMTISALSIWTIVPFMEDVILLRKELGNIKLGSLSLNILRFPSFQSINVISEPYKVELASDLEKFAEKQKDMLSESEINQILRVASYLRNVDKSYEDTDTSDNKINDFVNFVQQYATRRAMIIEEYLPDRCIQWFNSLKKDTSNG